MIDTLKRRRVSGGRTQRQADIAAATAAGEWTPVGRVVDAEDGRPTARDRTGINPLEVIEELVPSDRR